MEMGTGLPHRALYCPVLVPASYRPHLCCLFLLDFAEARPVLRWGEQTEVFMGNVSHCRKLAQEAHAMSAGPLLMK